MSRGTVLITGASSGLGAEMARQFADLGYDLALAARRRGRLEDLRQEILAGDSATRIEIASLDVTDETAVLEVFRSFAATFGELDRVVVNAGVGAGAPLGTGGHHANRATAETNFVAGLAQIEAAMEVFRRQRRGHLVVVSSISALRGMRRSMTTYAASKAGIAALAEGLQAERVPGVDVSIVYPGYIRSEMTEHVAQRTRLMVDTSTGVRSLVAAIEKRSGKAYVPAWPWVPLGLLLRVLPLGVVRRLT